MATLIKSIGLRSNHEYKEFVRKSPIKKFRFSPEKYKEWISWPDWLGTTSPRLSESHPELVKEWHPTKNGTLTPNNITAGSRQKVWWKGKCGHDWQSRIANRRGGIRGCPYCSGRKASVENCLATRNPNLAKEWHPTKNGKLTPFEVTGGSTQKVWWKGKCGHEWNSVVGNRNQGRGCPYCCGRSVNAENCLATNPKLAKEWHPTKNKSLTPNDVLRGSQQKVWWKGECGHEWEAVVYNRDNGIGCPYCCGQKVGITNCLATLNSKLAKEWHSTKNGKLTPNDVFVNSTQKAWWKGKCSHEWNSVVRSRNQGRGCPCCSGQKVCSDNCLATKNPKLAKEWHPTKNGTLTPNKVTTGSGQKVWWKCKQGHEWKAVIGSRNDGVGCPYCCGKIANKENSLVALNPKLAKEWHPTKNGSLNPCDFRPGSQQKIWWLCNKCKHEWKTFIHIRNRGSGCRKCSYKKMWVTRRASS